MKTKVKLLIEGQHFTLPPGIIPPGKRWMDGLQYEITDQVFRHPRYSRYYTIPPTPEMGNAYVVVKPKGISLQYAMDSQYLVALPEDTLVDLIFHIRSYPPRNPVRALNPASTRATATAVGTVGASATAAITTSTETIGNNRMVYWHPNPVPPQAERHTDEQSQSLQREVERLRANYALHGDVRPLASIPVSWFAEPVSVPPEQPSSLSDFCRRAEAMGAELEARTADLEQPNVVVMPSGWRIEQVVPQRPTPDQERGVQQLWAERNSQLNAAQWAAHRSPSPGDE